MNRLQIIKNDMGALYPKITRERIDTDLQKEGNYNTYRKLIDLMFKTFDTYSRLDRDQPDVNFEFVRNYYNFITKEANEITKILDFCSLEQYRCLVDIRNKLFEKSSELERWYDIYFNKTEDIIRCVNCQKEFSKSRLDSHFYLSNLSDSNRMDVCKDCVNQLYNKGVKELCQNNDLYYNEKLWETSQEKINPVSSYLKLIFSMPQYKYLRWKDSNYTKNIDEIIKVNNELGVLTYQQEIIESKDKNIICDWSRGAGKTFTIVKIIEINKPKNVLYVDNLNVHDSLNVLSEKFNDITDFNNSIGRKVFSMVTNLNQKNKLNLCIYNENHIVHKANIYTLASLKNGEIDKDIEFDYIFFSDVLPYHVGVKSKKTVSFISYNDKDEWLERLFPYCTISKIDYKTLLKANLLTDGYINRLKDSGYDKKFKNEYAILD